MDVVYLVLRWREEPFFEKNQGCLKCRRFCKTRLLALVKDFMYINNMVNSKALLSNDGEYISFSFNGRTIRFKGPYSLVRIARVKEWDNGYLVVDAVYSHSQDKLVEDYIDLVPILENLYIDPKLFLKPIKSVEVGDVRATA